MFRLRLGSQAVVRGTDLCCLTACIEVRAIRYLQKAFRVVRIKNRFTGDVAEAVSVERLQAEFYAAETRGEDTESNASGSSGLGSYAPLQGKRMSSSCRYSCIVLIE